MKQVYKENRLSFLSKDSLERVKYGFNILLIDYIDYTLRNLPKDFDETSSSDDNVVIDVTDQ